MNIEEAREIQKNIRQKILDGKRIREGAFLYYQIEQSIETVLNELDKKDKQIKQLNNRCKNLDREAQSYLEELAGDNGLKDRTIKIQDEVIDMMAEHIIQPKEFIIIDDRYSEKEQVKEYFYNKVENVD